MLWDFAEEMNLKLQSTEDPTKLADELFRKLCAHQDFGFSCFPVWAIFKEIIRLFPFRPFVQEDGKSGFTCIFVEIEDSTGEQAVSAPCCGFKCVLVDYGFVKNQSDFIRDVFESKF